MNIASHPKQEISRDHQVDQLGGFLAGDIYVPLDDDFDPADLTLRNLDALLRPEREGDDLSCGVVITGDWKFKDWRVTRDDNFFASWLAEDGNNVLHKQLQGGPGDAGFILEDLARGCVGGGVKNLTRPQPAKDNDPPVHATPFNLRDPADIPRREFLMGRHYVRQYMGATFGAGGGGKSGNAIVETLVMTTGRSLLPDGPTKPLRVWYVNLEDPSVETERRITGAAIHYGITNEQIGGRLFTDSGREQEFVIVREERRETKVIEPVVQGC